MQSYKHAAGCCTSLQHVFTSCQELKSCVSLSKSPAALIAELITAVGVWVSMSSVQSVPVDLCKPHHFVRAHGTAHRRRNDIMDNSPIRSVIFENRWTFESCAARIHSFSQVFPATVDSTFIRTNGQKVSSNNFDILIPSDSCSMWWRSDLPASPASTLPQTKCLAIVSCVFYF